MQPLSYDIRRMYRKHASGEEVSDTGAVMATYTIDGPYSIAVRPGGKSRTLGEQGYTLETTQFMLIADGVSVFEEGDVLTNDPMGTEEVFKVETVKTWPTEQVMYVRGL